LIPDEKTQGDLEVEVLTRRFPNGTQQIYGPYQMREPTSIRLNARQMSLKVTQVRTSDWRWGTPRVEFKAGGER